MKYGIKIVELDISKYSLENNDLYLGKKKPTGNLNIHVTVSVTMPARELSIKIAIQIYVHHPKNDALLLAGAIETISGYQIDNWDAFVKQNGKKYKVEEKLKSELVRISYDNTRGLLRERGRNDIMGKIVLPVLDPHDLLKSTLK
jgi:hypothetical protein